MSVKKLPVKTLSEKNRALLIGKNNHSCEQYDAVILIEQ